jgi:hypothetical protein
VAERRTGGGLPGGLGDGEAGLVEEVGGETLAGAPARRPACDPMRTRVVAMERPGAPDVRHIGEREAGAPAPGEALVRHGVNCVDVQHRTARYPLPAYPAVLGMEACGFTYTRARDELVERADDFFAALSAP